MINPFDKQDVQTRCAIYKSINHQAQNCLDGDNSEHNIHVVNEVVLHQTDCQNPQEHLMTAWSSAVLNCGASKTVCGHKWLNQYITNLSEHKQENIKFPPSNNVYCFGDWKKSKQYKM